MLTGLFCLLIAVSIINAEEKYIHENSTDSNVKYNITEPDPNIKYILIWTPVHASAPPFNQDPDLKDLPFQKLGCKHTNCFYTNNRGIFPSTDQFQAILFHGKEMNNFVPPFERNDKQLYVYVMDESVVYYPIENCIFNDFFNLTVTYRLDSDIPWSYMKVKDKITNEIWGPRTDMTWKRIEGKLNQTFLSRLSNKTELAAWFVSNCQPRNKRISFYQELQKELKLISNFSIDVFGKCGKLECPKNASEVCYEMLREKYLFYLAFENSDCEDYVTEKVLTALQNDVIPIVYGGANYSRFLPPDSYLDAKKLGPKNLAILMTYLYHNRTLYYKFFRWKLRYDFHNDTEMDYSCELCARLNSPINEVHTHPRLSDWWNDGNFAKDGNETSRCTYSIKYLISSKRSRMKKQFKNLKKQIDGIKRKPKCNENLKVV